MQLVVVVVVVVVVVAVAVAVVAAVAAVGILCAGCWAPGVKGCTGPPCCPGCTPLGTAALVL